MMNVIFEKDEIAQAVNGLWGIEKEVTDEEVDLVNRLTKKHDVFTYRQLLDLFFFYIRVDSKTNKLLTQGIGCLMVRRFLLMNKMRLNLLTSS